jgi:ATP-binding cassette subfamily F protein 3
MISLHDIELHYGDRTLFDNISFSIMPSDRIGLTGRNGAGKSTMLKLISGKIRPQKGNIAKPNNASVGYLQQELDMVEVRTVMEETMLAFSEVKELDRKIHEVQEQLTIRDDYETDSYMQLIHDLTEFTERFQILGGVTMQADAERVLQGLGFRQGDFNRLTNTFSGGWKMRIELAKLLLTRPDYLLLDEPTNHLDIESIIWLEGFLKTYPGAVVLISHDRSFLDAITTRTIEIELGKAYDYKASYSKYVMLREERRDQLQAAYDNQQQKIAQTERLIDRFKAKASKAKMAQSLSKQLNRMDRIELDDPDTAAMRIVFPPAPRSGDIALEVTDLVKSYDEKLILDKVSLMMERGERIGFVGKNGEGKTTLSKIIAGVEKYQGGNFKLGYNIELGYYAQNQSDTLDSKLTILQVMENTAPPEMRPRIRAILGAFLFSGDDVEKKISVLSGGERARVALACLLLRPINLLILDEPTNHLDMISKEILKDAIMQYDGTLIIVSHDRDFLTGLTDKTIEFRDRKLVEYLGDIQYFLEKRDFSDMREVSLGKQSEQAAKAAAPVDDSKAKQDKLNQQRQLEKKIHNVEAQITKLENEKVRLELAMADHTQYGTPAYDKHLAEFQKTEQALTERMAEWEKLQEEMELLG